VQHNAPPNPLPAQQLTSSTSSTIPLSVQQLDIWPPTNKTPHLADFEKSIGWPEKQATPDNSLLAFIPGA